MRTVSLRLADMQGATIPIGFEGENEYTQVRIDCKKVYSQHPDAVASLNVNDPVGNSYTVVPSIDDTIVVWNVTDSDLQSRGFGELQIVFTVDETVVGRSAVARTVIKRSVPGGGGSGGTRNYNDLENKPQINGTTLVGNKTLENLGIHNAPSGGSTNQVLAKNSAADYDFKWVNQSGGGGGTSDYDDLDNKPSINGVTLSGNKSLSDLSIPSQEDVNAKYTKPQGGIPASDIDPSAIPSPTSIIDDNAGEGDTNKVLSADKVTEITDGLREAVTPLSPLPKTVKDNTGTEQISFTLGGYIKNNTSTIDLTDITENQSAAYAIIDVTPGDVFTVWGTGFDTARFWCWINSSGGRIERKLAETTPVFITAPSNAAKLLLNVITTYSYGAYKGKLLNMAMAESDNAILEKFAEVQKDVLGVVQINLTPGAYIKTNEATIDASSPVANSAYSYAVIDCSPGDQFTVWGRGASYAYLYNFIDNSGIKLSQAQESLSRIVITAPANTTKLVLNRILQYEAGFYKGAIVDNGKAVGNQWIGKVVATYGDSITWYDGHEFGESHSEYGETAIGYQEYMKELGMTVVNKGESGARMTGILANIKADTGLSGYDAVTITCGANDFRYPTTEPLGQIAAIGSTFDETTMYGALQAAIEYLIDQKPSLKIILMAPIKGWASGTVMPEDYPNVFRTVGKLYSLPVCDWYDASGINALNRTTFIGDDEEELQYALHPTNAGFKMMGEMLKGFLAIH